MPDFSLEGLILKPLMGFLLTALQFVYKMFAEFSTNFFQLSIINKTLELFQYIMFGMFVIGLTLSLIDYATDQIDGNNPNAFNLLINNAKALFVAMFSQKLLLLLFEIAKFFTDLIFKLEKETKLFTENNLRVSMGMDSGTIVFIMLLAIILVFVLFVIIMFQYLERNGMFLLHLGMTCFYIVSICRGYTDPFTQWTKQGIAICFANTFQMLCLVLGFALFETPLTFLLGVGLFITASKTDRVMQQFSFSSGSRRNASAMMQAGMTAFQVATKMPIKTA